MRGFKSIAAAELDALGPITVLIGPNGAGKSNLLAALRLLGRVGAGLLGRSVADAGGANALLHRGAQHTQKIELEADFAQDERIYRYVAHLRYVAGDRLVFEQIQTREALSDSARVLALLLALFLEGVEPCNQRQLAARLGRDPTALSFCGEPPVEDRSGVVVWHVQGSGNSSFACEGLLRKATPHTHRAGEIVEQQLIDKIP